jgi:cell division inhibitor SepF
MTELINKATPLGSNYEVTIFTPRSLRDMTSVVQALRANKAVILNLEKIEVNEARRMSDFVSGSTYALSGQQSKLGNAVFLFTPNTIKISDQLKAEAVAKSN